MTFYILGLLVSLLCGIWFIYKQPEDKTWIYLILSAGGAFLITVLFTHILPELFESLGSKGGLVLLVGFGIQLFLENYSKGIEHGHAHPTTSKTTLFIAYAALCMHAIIEGMPLASAIFDTGVEIEDQLVIGIMLHKIPVAITLAGLLIKSNLQKTTALIWIVGFIICTILGSVLQYYVGQFMAIDPERLMFITLGLTVGILFHVATTILFESSDHHRLSPSRIIVIAMGVALGLIG